MKIVISMPSCISASGSFKNSYKKKRKALGIVYGLILEGRRCKFDSPAFGTSMFFVSNVLSGTKGKAPIQYSHKKKSSINICNVFYNSTNF